MLRTFSTASVWFMVLVAAGCLVWPGAPAASALDDAYWLYAINGNGSDPTKWNIGAVPNQNHYVHLTVGGSNYTVTVDGTWTIGDLETEDNAVVSLGGYTLTVNNGSTIRGELDVRGGQYNNDGSGNLATVSTSTIIGYGTIGQPLTGDDGIIQAQTSTLSVEFVSDTHNGATLIADPGAVLYVRNNDDVTSHAITDLAGGTLLGYDTGSNPYYHWILDGTSSNHAKIEGRGTVSRYYIGMVEYGEINANDGAGDGILALSQGFVGQTWYGPTTVSNGGTLNVTQGDAAYWNSDGATTMTGGSITGEQMRQRGDLLVNSGTNTIQNAILYDNTIGTNTVSGGATLRTSGNVYLDGAIIAESGAGGYFTVLSGSLVEGKGTISPDTTVAGTLRASVSGQTLAVNGTLNNQNTAYAAGGGTLDLNATVTNSGQLYANGGNVTIDAAATNNGGGNIYATGGSSLTLSSSLTNNVGASAYATSSGFLNLNGNVYNRGSVYASGGTVNVNGTIKAGTSETGDFAATSGTMNISAIEVNARNTFTANDNGTINLPGSPNTGNLYQTDALRPCGGTINIASGQTLTNASGKSVSGDGTLLDAGRNLVNQGTIEATGGTFNVHGNITNTGIMRAAAGYTLNVGSALTNGTGGLIYANANATVNLESAELINDASIYTDGSGALVTVSDAGPEGTGTFVADSGGTIRFANGFTNGSLGPYALQPVGGKITVASGSMTNAPNKVIAGFGTLLDPGITLYNSGTVGASGGALIVAGNVNNSSLLAAAGADFLQVSGTLTNLGTVCAEGGAAISLGSVTNDGLIEVVDGLGTGSIAFGNAIGDGRYSFDNGSMRFGSLFMSEDALLDDNDVADSSLTVRTDLYKLHGGLDEFDADQLSASVYGPLVGLPHRIQWQADDREAAFAGLDNNLALGHLTLGDGVGKQGTDVFSMTQESILYCYGLTIEADAGLDLDGATIYYLMDGLEHNGITGTGFVCEGSYYGGQIIPIGMVPEPAALVLLALGGLALLPRWQSARFRFLR
jgi:hypothetical protein